MSALNQFVNSTCEWLRGAGNHSDIVLSSRMRLARNVQGYPYSHRLAKDQSEKLIDSVESAIRSSAHLKDCIFLRQKDLTVLDKEFLLERHLISHEHANSKKEIAVAVSPTEITSIMVLEEDHLRIQVLQSGFNLTETWRMINAIDSELESALPYAFHPGLGYLCACPTNVGTGLRASCMMHLPALVMAKQVNKVLQALSKLNLAARGMYGEGTQASGNFFQFSNQITLGQSEEDIIDNLERVIRQIIEHEQEARQVLVSKKRERLDDQIWRALGILKTARLVSSKETTALLSMLRMGIDLGVIEGLNRDRLNKIFIMVQPAHLQKICGRVLSSQDRDFERAEIIRRELKDVVLK